MRAVEGLGRSQDLLKDGVRAFRTSDPTWLMSSPMRKGAYWGKEVSCSRSESRVYIGAEELLVPQDLASETWQCN